MLLLKYSDEGKVSKNIAVIFSFCFRLSILHWSTKFIIDELAKLFEFISSFDTSLIMSLVLSLNLRSIKNKMS